MEEEALIRAIVEGVGDDFPRGVYADWLEERGDPRAAYLRAEMEWARPRREGVRPEVPATLAEMAARLDALWVARVSRPPLGVCCEHLRFEKSGPQLGSEDVRAVERECGVTFPPQLVAFLLNYNGGDPETIGPWRSKAFVGVECQRYWFYPAQVDQGPRGQSSLQAQLVAHRQHVQSWLTRDDHSITPMVHWYLDSAPLCDTPDLIYTGLILVQGPNAGKVVTMDWSVEPAPWSLAEPFARDLAGYLAALLPPCELDAPAWDDRDDLAEGGWGDHHI